VSHALSEHVSQSLGLMFQTITTWNHDQIQL